MVVYILRSEKDGMRYVGISKDAAKRLEQYNRGVGTSTKYRRPFKLVYVEKCSGLKEA